MLKQLCSAFLVFVFMATVSLGFATPAHPDYLVKDGKIIEGASHFCTGEAFGY